MEQAFVQILTGKSRMLKRLIHLVTKDGSIRRKLADVWSGADFTFKLRDDH